MADIIIQKPLTNRQIEHAERRLQEALELKLEKWEKANPKPGDAKNDGFARLNHQQKYAAVRDGKAKLKKLDDIERYTYWTDAFEFPDEARIDAAVKLWNKKKDEYTRVQSRQAEKLRDKIILGTNGAQALALLEAFVKDKED